MFKQIKTLLLVAVFIMFIASSSFAAQQFCEGNVNSNGLCDISIDEDGLITYTGGQMAKYELATTSDTLTAIESGKTFVMESAVGSPSTMTLPDADVGLEFTFTQGSVAGSAARENSFFYIDPQDTDFIIFVNSEATSTMAAGDKIYNSNGYTADSIRLICAQDLYWYATDVRGTWTDGN